MKKAAIYTGAAAFAAFLIYAFFSDGEGFNRIGVIASALAIGYVVLAWMRSDARKRKHIKYGDEDGRSWREY
jgi:hypothetical protein